AQGGPRLAARDADPARQARRCERGREDGGVLHEPSPPRRELAGGAAERGRALRELQRADAGAGGALRPGSGVPRPAARRLAHGFGRLEVPLPPASLDWARSPASIARSPLDPPPKGVMLLCIPGRLRL